MRPLESMCVLKSSCTGGFFRFVCAVKRMTQMSTPCTSSGLQPSLLLHRGEAFQPGSSVRSTLGDNSEGLHLAIIQFSLPRSSCREDRHPHPARNQGPCSMSSSCHNTRRPNTANEECHPVEPCLLQKAVIVEVMRLEQLLGPELLRAVRSWSGGGPGGTRQSAR